MNCGNKAGTSLPRKMMGVSMGEEELEVPNTKRDEWKKGITGWEAGVRSCLDSVSCGSPKNKRFGLCVIFNVTDVA